MSERILCVDDDPAILDAYRRNLRKIAEIDVAASGEEALARMAEHGPYAVAIVDMHMPGMDGVQLLTRVREAAPDTVCMMLTGADDLRTAMSAVNEGHIFRFLAKPIPPTELVAAIAAGIHQHRLVTAERDLLEKTLAGSVRVMTEILSMVDPDSFGRAQEQRDLLRAVCERLHVADVWEIEVAAMLAGIGNVTIPPVVTLKARVGKELTPIEKDMLARVPEVGSRLLGNIPHLEKVARIVLYQNKDWEGRGFPVDGVAGEEIPFGARLLRVLRDLGQLEATGIDRARAVGTMRNKPGVYDPKLVEAVALIALTKPAAAARAVRSATMRELRPGMILGADLTTIDGKVLIGSGQALSETLLDRLRNFARISGIKEPITIVEVDPASGGSGHGQGTRSYLRR
jgi:response regulator RpfG family c-di-GMP phosphodiesterase